MGFEIAFLGPSGAGKTTLMRKLAETQGDYDFIIDRPWTTRQRRPGEDDVEYVFVDKSTFDAKRSSFLFTMPTYGDYEFGLEKPSPLLENQARMRILLPNNALRFRELLGGRAVLCAIVPGDEDAVLAERIRQRDPDGDMKDMQVRIERIHEDTEQARKLADVVFVNGEGIDQAVAALRSTLEGYFAEG